jgi:Rap1a immunity proteins
MVAEVIASAFASGYFWGGDASGKRAYCAPPDLKGGQIMRAFEEFLKDNPKMADHPYGPAMAGTLSKTFPCSTE